MRPILRHQSKLLLCRSYKPNRILRFKSANLKIEFRPVRFGVKPQIKAYECQS
jgi:hypothetical protein